MRSHLAEQRPEGDPSPFRAAIGRARVEALGATAAAIESDRAGAQVTRFEYRTERRSGKTKRDVRAWNALGARGWELVAVTGKHAHFKRPLS